MRRLMLFLVLLLPFAALAQEESDKDFLTRLLERSLSGGGRAVEIEGFAGVLSSEARFDRLTVSDEGSPWLIIEGAVVSWDRAALLKGRIDIASLAAESISLVRWPVSTTPAIAPEATPFSLPELPVSINVGALNASRIILSPDIAGAPVELTMSGQLALGGGEGSAQLAARRIDGATGIFTLEASYSNESRILKANLDLDEGDGGLAATALGIAGAPALRLTLDGEAPIDSFAATMALETNGARRLNGRIAWGLGDAAFYGLDLRGDISALFLPDYQAFFGTETQLIATAQRLPSGHLSLSEFALASRTLKLEGSAEIASGGWPERIALTGSLADPEGAAVLLPLSGAPTRVASVELSLSYDVKNGDEWRANLEVAGLERPGFLATRAALEGTGIISQGQDEGPNRFAGDIGFDATGVAFADDSLSAALGDRFSGSMSLEHIEDAPWRIRDLTATGPGLDLAANIDIAGPNESYLVRTDASLAAEDLGRFGVLSGRDLAGAARATVSGTIRPTDLSFDLRLDAETRDLRIGVAPIDPLLAGDAFGNGRLIRDAAGARIEGLNFQSARVSAKGALDLTSENFQGDFIMDVADLSLAAPGLEGPASLRLVASPDGNGATSVDLSAATAFERVTVKGAIPPQDPRRFEGVATASSDDLARFVSLVGVRMGGKAEAEISGGVALDLSELKLAGRAQTTDLKLFDEIFDALLGGGGEITLGLERAGTGTVDLPWLSVTTPNLALEGSLVRDGADPKARFSGRIADMALLAPEFSGPLEAQGGAVLGSNGRWAFEETTVSGPGGLAGSITGSISESLDADLRLAGSLPLGLLNGLLEPRRVAGMARVDLGLSGPLNGDILTRLSGEVSVEDSRLAAPSLGQALEGLNGTASFSGGAARIALEGRSISGGKARLDGVASLSPPFSGDLTLVVEAWRLRDPSLYDTSLDGAVTIRGPLEGGAMISGEVKLGATELRVPSSSISALGEIPEISHVAAPPAVTATLSRANLTESGAATGGGGAPYGLDIRIIAPEQVYIRGRGLDAELGGSLTLGGTTAEVVPVGYLGLIRGRLDILQQRFDLTEGSADIRGDLMPDIRLTATTTARSGTAVNLTIEGRLDAPEIVLSATPDLPQDEIISQLLFGRSIDQISPLQAVQLASAVATLAGRGGAGFVDNLRQRFGLDDLDVSSDTTGETTFRIGKYLGENLYSDVSISSGGQSEISLNLDLSDTLTAKGGIDSEGQTSLGIFFERDY